MGANARNARGSFAMPAPRAYGDGQAWKSQLDLLTRSPQSEGHGAPPHPLRPPPNPRSFPCVQCLRKGSTMKTIAKVLESMLTKDATQSWSGQAASPAPEGV